MALRRDLKDLNRYESFLRKGKTDADEFLYHVWQGLSSGEHLKYDQKAVSYNPAVGAAARRLSHERVLHFKDADSWHRYNQKFGSSSMRAAFVHGLDKQAKTTAIMHILGPSGSDNWEQLVLDLKKHFTKNRMQEQLDALGENKLRALRNRLHELDGSMNIPGNESLATVGTVTRNWTNMTRLGDVVNTSITDLPNLGTEARFQGYSFFKPIIKGFKELTWGKSKAEKMRVLSELGVAMDSMKGVMMGRFSGDELPGRSSDWARTYSKLNLLTPWTDGWRRAFGLMQSHELGLRTDMTFAQIHKEQPRLTHVLGFYGIDSGKWDIIRQAPTRAMDGRDCRGRTFFLSSQLSIRLLPTNYMNISRPVTLTEPSAGQNKNTGRSSGCGQAPFPCFR